VELKRVEARRYLQPLREGGSLPAVVETDGGLYVVKFRGAGQGARALIAEVIVGLLAAALGFRVPELVLVEIPEPFGRSERDAEIQDLLRASRGVNVGVRYLDGAFNFSLAAAGELVTADYASRLVWLDAYTTNPDRTHGNPNLLVWQRSLWPIDHGSALYAHHAWERVDEARVRTPFPQIAGHVLLDRADALRSADTALSAALDADVVAAAVEAVPSALLEADGGEADAERRRYMNYLTQRRRAPRAFVVEAEAARDRARQEPPRRRTARR
jgi:hypothetical protein